MEWSKDVIDKYKAIFENAIDIVVYLGFSERSDFIGCSVEELQALEKAHNTIFPPAVSAYLQTMGVVNRIKGYDFDIARTVSNAKAANELAIRHEPWREGMTVKEYLKSKNFRVNFDNNSLEDNVGIYTPNLSEVVDIDKIFIFYFEAYIQTFRFYDASFENPYIYYFSNNDSIVSNFSSITDTYRRNFFGFICRFAPYGFEFKEKGNKKAPQKLFDKPCEPHRMWMKEYSELLQGADVFKYKTLGDKRNVFYILNQEQEKAENRILTLDEFETNFIAYLKQF